MSITGSRSSGSQKNTSLNLDLTQIFFGHLVGFIHDDLSDQKIIHELKNSNNYKFSKKIGKWRDGNKKSILHLAVEKQRTDLVQWLLEKLDTWLIKEKSKRELIKLENRIQLKIKEKNNHTKVKNRKKTSIRSELINHQDEGGNTALHIAIIKNYEELVTILVANQADPHIYNNQKETPYRLAEGNDVLSRLLVPLTLRLKNNEIAISELNTQFSTLSLSQSGSNSSSPRTPSQSDLSISQRSWNSLSSSSSMNILESQNRLTSESSCSRSHPVNLIEIVDNEDFQGLNDALIQCQYSFSSEEMNTLITYIFDNIGKQFNSGEQKSKYHSLVNMLAILLQYTDISELLSNRTFEEFLSKNISSGFTYTLIDKIFREVNFRLHKLRIETIEESRKEFIKIYSNLNSVLRKELFSYGGATKIQHEYLSDKQKRVKHALEYIAQGNQYFSEDEFIASESINSLQISYISLGLMDVYGFEGVFEIISQIRSILTKNEFVAAFLIMNEIYFCCVSPKTFLLPIDRQKVKEMHEELINHFSNLHDIDEALLENIKFQFRKIRNIDVKKTACANNNLEKIALWLTNSELEKLQIDLKKVVQIAANSKNPDLIQAIVDEVRTLSLEVFQSIEMTDILSYREDYKSDNLLKEIDAFDMLQNMIVEQIVKSSDKESAAIFTLWVEVAHSLLSQRDSLGPDLRSVSAITLALSHTLILKLRELINPYLEMRTINIYNDLQAFCTMDYNSQYIQAAERAYPVEAIPSVDLILNKLELNRKKIFGVTMTEGGSVSGFLEIGKQLFSFLQRQHTLTHYILSPKSNIRYVFNHCKNFNVESSTLYLYQHRLPFVVNAYVPQLLLADIDYARSNGLYPRRSAYSDTVEDLTYLYRATMLALLDKFSYSHLLGQKKQPKENWESLDSLHAYFTGLVNAHPLTSEYITSASEQVVSSGKKTISRKRPSLKRNAYIQHMNREIHFTFNSLYRPGGKLPWQPISLSSEQISLSSSPSCSSSESINMPNSPSFPVRNASSEANTSEERGRSGSAIRTRTRSKSLTRRGLDLIIRPS